MVWFKVDDIFAGHRKPREAGLEAIGLWTVAGSWCSQQLTDGHVPAWYVETWPKGSRLATALVRARLWHAPGHSCEECPPVDAGWIFHDWGQANPFREQVEAERDWNRRRQALARDPELREAIRQRDRDRCRYCGVAVNWRDRRGAAGGTYDHIIPRGPDTLDNVVVCCRACNARKGSRPLAECGMTLLPTGSLSGSTQSGPRSDPEATQCSARTVQDTRPDPTRPVLKAGQSGGGSPEPYPPAAVAPPPGSTTSRPRCGRHANLPPDEPGPNCRDCRDTRLAAETAGHDAERARRDAIRRCRMCDGEGDRLDLLLTEGRHVRCDHQARAAVSA